MSFQRANASDLRMGLYIKLAGSWFQHPFPTNTFKIKTDKELATIRSLRNIKIFFDPDKSDPTPEANVPAADVQHPANLPPLLEEDGCFEVEEISAEREQRIATAKQRRQCLVEAEQSYQEVLDENKMLMREVSCGYVKGMRKAEKLMTVLTDILGNDGSLVALMNLMGNHEVGDESYYHSLNTAILSMVVARDLELSQTDSHMIGLAALFHDIGQTTDEGDVHAKGTHLSEKQQHTLRRHPHIGKRMLEKGFSFPKPSLDAIFQHHERLNGTGYPQGLRNEAIHVSAKIIMVIDAYDDLCNSIDTAKNITPYEAMRHLYAKRDSEYWENAIVSLIRCLGVYPPSSLVELTDGSIGIVSTINLQDRLRPLIMLYNHDVPQ
ncbi:MAG: HD domain-containing phosphohydrolase, partial [Nitrospirota bacterium]|nr:HD domain-containing phosphohydrolase [Nitrospirota bacterium]